METTRAPSAVLNLTTSPSHYSPTPPWSRHQNRLGWRMRAAHFGTRFMVERANGRRRAADDSALAPAPEPEAGRSRAAKFGKKTIALVYDFDGTLSPRPMQEYAFLPKIGADARAFWAE